MNLFKSFKLIALSLALMYAIGVFASQASQDIRGPVAEIQEYSPYHVGYKQPSGDFSGFYYDIDDDLGNENLKINMTSNSLMEGSVQYKTKSDDKDFEFDGWGQYKIIGFMGEKYFVGYCSGGYLAEISEDSNLLEDGLLLKILKDEFDEKVISPSSPLKLQQGYELRIKDLDLDGNKIYLELYKDGNILDEKVLSPSSTSTSDEDKTYYYSKSFGDSVGSNNEIAIIAVRFDNAYRSDEECVASVEAIFQLSDKAILIQNNDQYGNMTVTNVDHDDIELENSDRVMTLNKDRDIALMADFYIKTADQEADDQNPLRFYIYRNITKVGSYEVRGDVAEAVDGNTLNWTAQNFPGFFYDLDDDIGQEVVSINTTFSNGSYLANPGSIVYKSNAEERTFERDAWGNYYFIGFMGEPYFAGYVEDTTNPDQSSMLWNLSGERNPLANEKIFKVLMDSDDELNPLSANSALSLQEGYELLIKEIDVTGKKIDVDLRKDGNRLDNKVIALGEDNGTYSYEIPISSGGSNKLITIAVHFQNAYHGTDEDYASIDGIWQISDSPLNINWGRDLGEMTIYRIDAKEGEMVIEMNNEDKIKLRDGKKILLMNDFYIKTADQDSLNQSVPLRFYIFREMNMDNELEGNL